MDMTGFPVVAILWMLTVLGIVYAFTKDSR